MLCGISLLQKGAGREIGIRIIRMGKMTFMGAGSSVFARNVIGDMMLCDALRDFEIAMYDIDAERLEESYRIVHAINHNLNEDRAKLVKYCGVENRRDALRGADFVVNAIQVGLYKPCTVTDFEVPKNTVCVRPLPTRWVSAVSSVRCAPSRCLRILPRTFLRSARMLFS